MRRYTQKGRVVYDRPKHIFKFKDFLRLAKKTNSQIYSIMSEDWEAFVETVKKAYEDAAGATLETRVVLGHGGEFGGGGATRTFESPLPGDLRAGMIFIIEESA